MTQGAATQTVVADAPSRGYICRPCITCLGGAMPSSLPAFVSSLSLSLLLVSSAHAGSFEHCSRGVDFEYTQRWSVEDWDLILKGCNDFIKQTRVDTRRLPIAYTNRGNARPALELESAIADYGKAIEIDPSHAEAYYRRGNAYWKMECSALVRRCSLDRALSDYDKAIEIDPRHRWAYGRRASAHEE